MSLKTLASNAIWSLFAHILGRGSLVLASLLLARSLETSEFAAYSYFNITVSMLAAYAGMGLGVTASRFFAESVNSKEQELPPIGTLWILSIIVGGGFAFIVFVIPSAWLVSGLNVPQWLLALAIFSMALGVVPTGAIVGLERYPEAVAISGLSGALLLVGAVVAGEVGNAVSAMLALTIAGLIQSMGNAYIVLRCVGLSYILRHANFNKSDLIKIAGFAGPMVAVSLLAASGSWVVGRIILDGPSGEHGFSLYAIGLQWFSLALLLPGMVSRVVLPRLISIKQNASSVSQLASKKLLQSGALLTAATVILVVLVGVIVSPWLLHLYGTNYAIDKWLIAVFMIAAIPSAPANTLGNAIIAHDGQSTWLGMTVIWFVCIVIASLVFVSKGAFGGALAHGIASTVITILAYIWVRKRGLV